MIQKNIQKLISIVAMSSLLFVNTSLAFAQEAPPPPPTAPIAPTAPENNLVAPTAPIAPTGPTSPDSDEPTQSSTLSDDNDDEDNDWSSDGDWNGAEEEAERQARIAARQEAEAQAAALAAASQTATTGDQTGYQTDSQNVGGAAIDTGNATNSVSAVTLGNNNLSAGVAPGDGSGASVANSGNGADSTNNGAIDVTNNSNTIQDNDAHVVNNLNQYTSTGDNRAEDNLGGNVSINTGDANTTGTLITSVNTNVDGVAVAEFNVVEDQVGDLILDFDSYCIIGCGTGSLQASNTGNLAGSTNDATINLTENNNTFQTNDAVIENTMVLASETGENVADDNGGGSVAITTGDANVAANSLTFANNNLAGNILYGVVNIFGDLIGDIVLPESYLNTLCSNCGSNLVASNTGNLAGSTNESSVSQTFNDTTNQFNTLDIDNVLLIDAETGGNTASRNGGDGGAAITTGDTNIEANIFNVANSNVNGGTWWLVLVNEAGNWVGRILGSPDGASMAGSAGTEFSINADGEIVASNSGNGADSTNNATVNQTVNNNTTQINNATINNFLDLSAVTGRNTANDNIGGDVSITTGDANIVANLVNFVNNNIAGNGRLIVTVVNVFGSWFGDFVAPGQIKESSTADSGNQNPTGAATNNPPSNTQSKNPTSTPAGATTNSNNNTTAVSSTNTSSTGGSAGFLGFGFPTILGGGDNDGGESAVLGQVIENDIAGNKKIKINLAWAILALPLIGFWFYLKFRPSAKLQ
jgi:hypothetical protein